MSFNVFSIIDRRYLPTTIVSKDGRFSMYFKPVAIYLNDTSKKGVYLYDGNDTLLFTECSFDSGWHDAECELLGQIEKMDCDEETKKSLSEFVWSVIVDQDREKYENGTEEN